METIREKKRIVLEFDSEEDAEMVQRALDMHRYLQLVKKSKATDQEINDLADELNRNWWKENKHRFIQ